MGVGACRRIGGEPLWIMPKKPAIFVSARLWPQISLNRRLPGTSQRLAGLSVRCADE
jgi:hypothetical protein